MSTDSAPTGSAAPPTPAAAPVPAAPSFDPAAATALPPPPPPGPESGDRTSKMLGLLAVVGLGAALVMTLLWLGARNDAAPESSAPVETVAPGDGTVDPRVVELESQLAAAQEAQATAEATADELRDELTDAEAAGTDPDELTAVQEELATATTAVADAETRITELEADLAEAQAALAEAEAAREAAEAGSGDVDITQTPEFARWVGELLSSRTGGSRLGQADATCFGTEVIALIGLDAVGAGQNNAASGAARQAVIEAMNTAAGTCGIDPGLIFG